jgi:ABC-type nitrate/sulfonate/bicarbonate transport system substrate-binding protein
MRAGRSSWTRFLAVVVLGLSGCAGTATPAPAPAPAGAAPPAAPPTETPAPALTVVRGGQVAAVAYPFYIGIDRGYYREQGIDLQFETFRAGSDMVPMLASGQLDVGQQAVVPSTFNAALRGLPIKAILDGSRAIPGQQSHAVLVRKELWDSGTIRTLPDLVGRRVATSSLPGGLMIDVDRGLRQYGHRIEDTDQVQLPFPDMPAALANGSIDVAVAVEPAISTALNQGAAAVLGWLSEYYPDHEIAVQVIGPSLVEHPDLARRFVLAYLRGARDWNDAAVYGVGVEELAQLLSPYNRLPPEVNAALLRRRGLTSIDPDGRVNKESMAYDMNWYLERGYLERPVDLDQFVDHQYVDWAVARLGPYVPPQERGAAR